MDHDRAGEKKLLWRIKKGKKKIGKRRKKKKEKLQPVVKKICSQGGAKKIFDFQIIFWILFTITRLRHSWGL